MATQRVFLFGDQMQENLPVVRRLVHQSRGSPLLRRFLRESTDIVQLEAYKLDTSSRQSFCEFETLLSLAEDNAKLQNRNELVNTTLMCIARLGNLILIAEQDPGILGSSGSSIHIGICTGLLPVAAAAVATDTSQLLRYGLELVAITIRLSHGLVVRAKGIETESGSWSYTTIGIKQEQAQLIIDEFNHVQNLPSYKYVYISAFSSTWCTISGPPSVLARLWCSPTPMGQSSRLELPAAGPVHAAHLPCLDVDKILSSSAKFLAIPVSADVRVLSPYNGEAYTCATLGDMLSAMIKDISQNHMDLTQAFQKGANAFRDGSDVDLLVLGPTAHADSVHSALKRKRLRIRRIDSVEDAALHERSRDGTGLVAVVGMSGRLPGGNSLQEFWESLQGGQDLHCEIPKSRFDWKEYFDSSGKRKNTTSTPYGCFLENPGLFDNQLFNVSPREALQMDPMQRLILMTSYEALEMAGYGQKSLSTASNRISTYIGQVTDDWRSINECQGIDIYYVPGLVRAFMPSRINYHFKWEGPSYSVDSACASSSTAISLACSALLARDCDTALAGGAAVMAAPRDYAGLSKGSFLSPTGNCKTFQDGADGYCRGEGAGVVVLKRLEDALAENDSRCPPSEPSVLGLRAFILKALGSHIQGVISGWARTFSAKAASITQPHAETQKHLYKRVLQQACTSPEEISYVEMHGTGTQVGDSIEMESVAGVFGGGRREENPLTVGAVKANVGHGEGVAGVTSLIKIILMLREDSIPPQPGMPFKINHRFPPLSKMHIRIADRNLRFEPPLGGDGKRRILLNNFDASGGNNSLIIEDPPPRRAHERRDPRTYHIVNCSARTHKSLFENQRRLCAFIKTHPQTRLSDLSYTTTARRLHHMIRRSYSANTVDDLVRQIDFDISKGKEPQKSAPTAIFTFTGQGSAYSGMARHLFETCSRFRNNILSYQKICDSHNLPHVLDIFTDLGVDLSSKSTFQIQLAIIFLEVGVADLVMSWGIRPTLLIGHSLGEYAAMCVSGVLSLTDTFYLIGQRSALLKERCIPGAYAMLALGCPLEQLKPMLFTTRFQSCEIACINAPKKTVVSGPMDDLMDFRDLVQSQKIPTHFLKCSYGFHSSQIDCIVQDFESSAKGVHYAAPTIPVASTLMAGTVVKEKGIFSPSYLARQARETVNFAGTLQACEAAGLITPNTIWIEFGPEPVNLGLIRDTLGVNIKSLLPMLKSSEDNWKTISHAMSVAYTSAFTVDWNEYHKEYSDGLNLLELPFYAFDLKDYWATYDKGLVSSAPPEVKAPAQPLAASFVPSTTLQHLLQESMQSNDAIYARFSSTVTEPLLLAAIQGHVVNGTALCPASVFCDMALAAATYIFKKSNAFNAAKIISAMVIEDLEITHPLVYFGVGAREQTVEVKVSKAHDSGLAEISFSSKMAGLATVSEHGACAVRLGEAAKVQREENGSSHEAKAKLDALVMSAKTGQQLRLPRNIVYKLFASLVDYKASYQGMIEVYLDKGRRDGAALVRLPSDRDTGNFVCNPYWLDAVIHLAGFLLIGDVSNQEDIAYLSTGFKELLILERLRPDTDYMVFSSFQAENEQGLSSAEVYVFRDQKTVTMCTGLVFRKITKSLLRTIIGQTEVPPRIEPSEQWTDNKASSLTNRSTVGLKSKSASSLSSDSTPAIAQTVLELVASETGYDRDIMGPSTLFTDMGVDSMMSIAIISAVNERTGVELPSSYFLEHPTVADVTDEPTTTDETSGFVSEPQTSYLSTQKDDNSAQPTDAHFTNHAGSINPSPKETIQAPPDLSAFTSRCVLVRGRAMSEATPLFLIVGGAGSAAAYIHIPALPDGGRIYALESPFLGDPSKYAGRVEDVASVYRIALQKVQPVGPYIIGGWSAGAVWAYEVARQLTDRGENLLGLVLIDMRVPKQMPDGMEATIELIEEAGLLLGHTRASQPVSSVPHSRKLHLLRTVERLMVYTPLPMEPERRPANTCLIWAKKGLKERDFGEKVPEPEETEEESPYFGNVMEDPKTGLRSWFYAKRTNFGPNGWNKLVGDVDIHTIDGDHFSIVVPPDVDVLGQILRTFMEKSVAKGT